MLVAMPFASLGSPMNTKCRSSCGNAVLREHLLGRRSGDGALRVGEHRQRVGGTHVARVVFGFHRVRRGSSRPEGCSGRTRTLPASSAPATNRRTASFRPCRRLTRHRRTPMAADTATRRPPHKPSTVSVRQCRRGRSHWCCPTMGRRRRRVDIGVGRHRQGDRHAGRTDDRRDYAKTLQHDEPHSIPAGRTERS